jgi:hypothetical protein
MTTMKTKLRYLFGSIGLLLLTFPIQSCNQTIELNYSIIYYGGNGGSISGSSMQTVLRGENGTSVTAVPKTGYSFLIWSDGLTTATRQEIKVTENLSLTATFGKSTNE